MIHGQNTDKLEAALHAVSAFLGHANVTTAR
jgi:hypothetical protein